MDALRFAAGALDEFWVDVIKVGRVGDRMPFEMSRRNPGWGLGVHCHARPRRTGRLRARHLWGGAIAHAAYLCGGEDLTSVSFRLLCVHRHSACMFKRLLANLTIML